MNFKGTKLGNCYSASVTEFMKRITTFTHLGMILGRHFTWLFAFPETMLCNGFNKIVWITIN